MIENDRPRRREKKKKKTVAASTTSRVCVFLRRRSRKRRRSERAKQARQKEQNQSRCSGLFFDTTRGHPSSFITGFWDFAVYIPSFLHYWLSSSLLHTLSFINTFFYRLNRLLTTPLLPYSLTYFVRPSSFSKVHSIYLLHLINPPNHVQYSCTSSSRSKESTAIHQ